MSSSEHDAGAPHARAASVTDDALVVELIDGRTLSVPLAWYPRLAEGSPSERADLNIIGSGAGIHWPQLDEDISIEGLLAGQPSGESQRSLDGWRAGRAQR